jgi:hypothetical protein
VSDREIIIILGIAFTIAYGLLGAYVLLRAWRTNHPRKEVKLSEARPEVIDKPVVKHWRLVARSRNMVARVYSPHSSARRNFVAGRKEARRKARAGRR